MATIKKKKVLIIGPKDAVGGHGTYVNDVLRYPFKNCVVLNFNTTKKFQQVKRKGLSETIDIYHTPVTVLLLAITVSITRGVKFIVTLFREWPEIILITGSSNLFYEQAFYIILSKLMRRKVFLHYHGPFDLFFNECGIFKRGLVGIIYRRLDKLILLSRKDFNIAKNIIPAHKLIIIPTYVRISNYSSNFFQKPSSVDGLTRIVFLGGSKPLRKGIRDLAGAINHIVPIENKVIFMLSGGDDVNKIIDSNIDPKCKHAVSFLGWVMEENKRKIYQDSDIMVLPSYDEGLPYALIEAMASGMAVVSTNIGGIPELIPTKEYGFLIQPGDIPALTEALLILIRDKALRAQLGANNIDRVKKYYVMDRILGSIEEVLLG